MKVNTYVKIMENATEQKSKCFDLSLAPNLHELLKVLTVKVYRYVKMMKNVTLSVLYPAVLTVKKKKKLQKFSLVESFIMLFL